MEARWGGDGRFYPARVTGFDPARGLYTVGWANGDARDRFKRPDELRPRATAAAAAAAATPHPAAAPDMPTVMPAAAAAHRPPPPPQQQQQPPQRQQTSMPPAAAALGGAAAAAAVPLDPAGAVRGPAVAPEFRPPTQSDLSAVTPPPGYRLAGFAASRAPVPDGARCGRFVPPAHPRARPPVRTSARPLARSPAGPVRVS